MQIFLGGLVAGLDAGMSYNDWPLMDGAVIPGDLLVIDPAWRNFFENPKTVQFVHRLGAYTLFVLALWHMIATRRRQPGTTHARRALVLFHLVLIQAAIGIAALMMQMPLHWALLHQGFRADRARLCRRALARHERQPIRCRRRSRSGRDRAGFGLPCSWSS